MLSGTDHVETCRTLTREISQADIARIELERFGQPRRRLEATLQALRFPGASGATTDELRLEQQALDQERDRWFRVSEALAELLELASSFGSNAGFDRMSDSTSTARGMSAFSTLAK